MDWSDFAEPESSMTYLSSRLSRTRISSLLDHLGNVLEENNLASDSISFINSLLKEDNIEQEFYDSLTDKDKEEFKYFLLENIYFLKDFDSLKGIKSIFKEADFIELEEASKVLK